MHQTSHKRNSDDPRRAGKERNFTLANYLFNTIFVSMSQSQIYMKSGKSSCPKQPTKIFHILLILCFIISSIYILYHSQNCPSSLQTHYDIYLTGAPRQISNNIPSSFKDPYQKEFYAEFNNVSLNTHNCSLFPSQHGEDYFIFKSFFSNPKPMTNGIFLESGAWDGKRMSNSYFFEYCLGWKGVLIEAHPEAVIECKKNRPDAIVIDEAICDQMNGSVTFVGDANSLSGIKDYVSTSYLEKLKQNGN